MSSAIRIAKAVGLSIGFVFAYLALSLLTLVVMHRFGLGGSVVATLVANTIFCVAVLAVVGRRLNAGLRSPVDLPGAAIVQRLSARSAIIMTSCAVIVWFVGQATARWMLSTWPQKDFAQYQDAIRSAPILLVLVTSIISAPITEEILMRGLVYSKLRSSMSMWPAALSSSLVFGLMHGTAVHMAYAVTLGVLLALVYEATHRLWLPIAIHVAYNFLAFVPQRAADAFGVLPWVIIGNALVLAALLSFPRLVAAPRDDSEDAGAAGGAPPAQT